MPINFYMTFVHTTDGRVLCQLSAYIYINIEMTQISATWEVLTIERFLTNLTTFWLYEICGGFGLYIQYTLHTPTEKPFLSTHPLSLIGQRSGTFCLLYGLGVYLSYYLNSFRFPPGKYRFSYAEVWNNPQRIYKYL